MKSFRELGSWRQFEFPSTFLQIFPTPTNTHITRHAFITDFCLEQDFELFSLMIMKQAEDRHLDDDGAANNGDDPAAGLSYHPPINFATVEDRIYRSGFPQPSDFPFLDTLQLRSVMWVPNYLFFLLIIDPIDDQFDALLQIFVHRIIP